jgi:hypothetical protein
MPQPAPPYPIPDPHPPIQCVVRKAADGTLYTVIDGVTHTLVPVEQPAGPEETEA